MRIQFLLTQGVHKLAGIVGQEVVGNVRKELEPEAGQIVENATLVRNAAGENPVIGADTVGANDGQAMAKVVDITHFS